MLGPALRAFKPEAQLRYPRVLYEACALGAWINANEATATRVTDKRLEGGEAPKCTGAEGHAREQPHSTRSVVAMCVLLCRRYRLSPLAAPLPPVVVGGAPLTAQVSRTCCGIDPPISEPPVACPPVLGPAACGSDCSNESYTHDYQSQNAIQPQPQ